MSGRRKTKSRKAGVVVAAPSHSAARPQPPAPSQSAAKPHTIFLGIAPYLALFAVTVLAYLRALNGGVLWDDDAHITKRALQSLEGLWRIWFQLGATQQYYPLLHSAFWLEHRLWGDTTFGYHLVNILLHAASACLVVRIARRLALPGAWLAGFVFALHPVCVESVAWISEQKSTLSGVLCLGAALVYLKFDASRRRSDYFLALALFLTALAAKTVTAAMPAALLVILWWRRGALRWKEDAAPLVPWLAVGAVAGLFTAYVEREYIGAHGGVFDISLADRFLIAGRALWFYAAKLVWPANLTFIYPRWKLDAGLWWQWLFPAGVVLVAAGLARFARRNRGPLAAFLVFAGMLFPALGFVNIFPFRYSFVADHFQYLASLGLIVPLCSVLTRLVRRTPKQALAIVPLVLTALTFQQTRQYAGAETLYRETLARNPECWMAHNNLGGLYAALPGRAPDAIAEYEAALRIEPNIVEAETSLGNTLRQIPGHEAEALQHLEKALRIDPGFAIAHYNLGVALALIPGRLPDAIAQYRAAIQIDPEYVKARSNLAVALARIPGRRSEAVAELETALRIDPNQAVVHNDLGFMLANAPDRLSDAIAEYETALRIQPDYVEAHINLAEALSQIPERVPDAIAHLRTALQLHPDSAEAHAEMGSILLRVSGRGNDAITELKAALKIKPDLAEAHYSLGLALSDVPGQLPAAIAEYQAALHIRPAYAEAHNNLGLILMDIPGRLPDAIAEFEAALQIDPNLMFAHYNLGVALSKLPGRLPEAIGHLEAALRISPNAEPVRQMLGRLRAASAR